MIQRETSLTANIVAFCRFLRENGFRIGFEEQQDALQALDLLAPFDSPDDLQLCLQTALCRNRQQVLAFAPLYKKYWRELDRAIESKTKDFPEKKDKSKTNPAKPPSLQALKSWLYGNKETETTETATYSAFDGAGQPASLPFDERELQEVFALVKKLVRRLANRRSRRFQPTHKKTSLDMKKTVRRNIIRHGELIELVYRKKKKENIKVVLLCDVSRSMELYSRFLLQFLYAFQNLFPKINSFVFSTTLHPITEELTGPSLTDALERILEKTSNWSGGTRIGASLAHFNEHFAHKCLSPKTLTIVLSDGWDTGDPGLVAENMRQIRRRSLRVLWLNPLAGSPGWAPEVQGMKEALPFTDVLLPFHNLDSLREVVKKLRW